MNKSTANSHARSLYHAAMTRGKFETTKADWHAVYYPEDGIVIVHYLATKGRERQHVCKVRKNWIYG